MTLADVVLDAVFIITGIATIIVIQYVHVAALDEFARVIIENGDNIDIYSGESAINGMYVAVTKWVPMLAGAGLVVLGLMRAWLRVRVANVRAPPPR